MPGRSTLTAASVPSCSRARCTCATEALATGVSVEAREHLAATACRRRAPGSRPRARESKRRHPVLQLGQLVGDVGGQQVAARRQHLAELDEDRSERLPAPGAAAPRAAGRDGARTTSLRTSTRRRRTRSCPSRNSSRPKRKATQRMMNRRNRRIATRPVQASVRGAGSEHRRSMRFSRRSASSRSASTACTNCAQCLRGWRAAAAPRSSTRRAHAREVGCRTRALPGEQRRSRVLDSRCAATSPTRSAEVLLHVPAQRRSGRRVSAAASAASPSTSHLLARGLVAAATSRRISAAAASTARPSPARLPTAASRQQSSIARRSENVARTAAESRKRTDAARERRKRARAQFASAQQMIDGCGGQRYSEQLAL